MSARGSKLILAPDGFLSITGGADMAIGVGQFCTLSDFAETFCTNTHRAELFEGYLRFRKELSRVGIRRGMQWLNGSYVTPKEEPRDIDVVTFCYASDYDDGGVPARALTSHESDPNQDARVVYNVDSYVVRLDDRDPTELIENALYWHEWWSRRRDPPGSRKGFAIVDLSESSDEAEALVRARLSSSGASQR